jgi:hypothetical protein
VRGPLGKTGPNGMLGKVGGPSPPRGVGNGQLASDSGGG